MKNDKIFYIKDIDKKQVIKYNSAGVCFYNDSDNLKIMMLKKNNNKWEFLGGKTNKNDIDLLHTAVREGVEESNGCITGLNNNYNEDIKNIIDLLYNSEEPIYWYSFSNYNYGLFFIKVPDNKIYSSKKYGEFEILENLKRTIHWLDTDQINNILKNEETLNFKVDSFILSNIYDIIKNPEKTKFLNKWMINKKSYDYFMNLG